MIEDVRSEGCISEHCSDIRCYMPLIPNISEGIITATSMSP